MCIIERVSRVFELKIFLASNCNLKKTKNNSNID